MANKKFVRESRVVMTELVLPNDTNTLNNLMGGRLMHWMDIGAAIAAQRHSNRIVVTASVDNISFGKPIQLGDVVTLTASISRAFNSSMEVYIKVKSENIPGGKSEVTHSAFFTFVAFDKSKKPLEVPELIPKTKEEIKFYKGALERRQARLQLARKNR